MVLEALRSVAAGQVEAMAKLQHLDRMFVDLHAATAVDHTMKVLGTYKSAAGNTRVETLTSRTPQKLKARQTTPRGTIWTSAQDRGSTMHSLLRTL